jgi:hypothetical protein
MGQLVGEQPIRFLGSGTTLSCTEVDVVTESEGFSVQRIRHLG